MTNTITGRDRARQAFVSFSWAFMILGTLFGFGVIGTRVEESSGGALAADATLLAPASAAFSIWSVIYTGLTVYTIWQWLPRNAASDRERAIGWLAGVSMILNASWLLVTQAGLIWPSVLVIGALAVVLGLVGRALTRNPDPSVAGKIITDGSFGLYLGWVSIATAANITAAGFSSGWDLGVVGNQVLAVVVLAVAAGIGVMLARAFGGRYAPAAALAWGLSWIAIGRLTDAPASTAVGVTAAIAALVVVGATIMARRKAPATAVVRESVPVGAVTR